MGKGNAYLIMWKCVYGYGNMHIWLCQDTGAMNRPLRLAWCSLPILCIYNASCKIGRNLFVLWLLRIRKTKRGFLQHKNHTFAMQKPPFCTTKTILLKRNNILMVLHLPYLQNAMHTFWHNKHTISALLKLFCVPAMLCLWAIWKLPKYYPQYYP